MDGFLLTICFHVVFLAIQVQSVQMLDVVLQPGASHTHYVPSEMDNTVAYVYAGAGEICGQVCHSWQAEMVQEGRARV